MLYLLFFLHCINGLNIFISQFESPPIRFLTDGMLVVGVSDGICEIETKWKESSKKAAGMTRSKVMAVDFLKQLDYYGFYAINPFYDDNHFIEVSLTASYHNCKVVTYNLTHMTNNDYIVSNNIVKEVSNTNGFNEYSFIDNTTRKKEPKQLTTLVLVMITLSSILFVICIMCICYKLSSFSKVW